MKMKKNSVLGTLIAGAFVIGAVSVSSQANAAWWWPFGGSDDTAQAKSSEAMTSETYDATFYVAGMGGHFAEAEVTIDPSKEQPIQLKNLSKMDIGAYDTHPTHDPRIDAKNRDSMFWSTYKIDKATGKMHVGKTDLKTGEKVMDVDVPVPDKATKTKSMYCASAQTADYYMPISMANKGYIDVFRKSDLKQEHTVFLEGTDADIQKPYKFYHGVNSSDLSKVLITINEADKDHGKTIGKIHMLELDAKALEKGKVKVVNKGVIPGAEGSTISFRQYYSNDDTLIANSGADRLFLIDTKTLKAIDAEMMPNLEQNHDAIFTPDDRYVVLTVRTKVLSPDCKDPENPASDEYTMDGQLRLYDVQAKKLVGKPTSVCLACHNEEGIEQHAVLCGLDANFASK